MPVVTAVSSSARQLFLLLRCISFTPKAQVQITPEGLRFSVEESRVMQGLVFLGKELFTSYRYDGPEPPAEDQDTQEDGYEPPTFQISLPALLETLQIFGFADSKDRWSTREGSYTSGINGSMARGGVAAAFDNRVLGMSGICRLSYEDVGEPLQVGLEEGNVTTTCSLVTYVPESMDDIPFDRDQVALKIVMRASWLYDAITELSSTSPERLTISASPSAPYFSLSASGALGSATVEFTKDPQLLETFQAPRRLTNSYKFSMIKAASRTMAIASKVSIRGDTQGVLNLQFMIEVEGGGVSFVDFRFVPFIADDEEEEADGTDEE